MRPLRSTLIVATVSIAGIGAFLAFAPSCYDPSFGSPGFYCHTDDSPACPDGQSCVNGRCIGGGAFDMAGGIVPKTGSYSGPTLDPGLSDGAKCPDIALEPNDSIANAIPSLNTSLNLVVDANSPKLQNLAICPTGNNPKANGHDSDYYEFDVSTPVYVLVEINYDVKYGDLDVGIFSADGTLVAYDGSATSNGCIAPPSQLPAGKYYVGIGGANNKDSNRYDLRIRFFSMAKTCTSTLPDMSMGN